MMISGWGAAAGGMVDCVDGGNCPPPPPVFANGLPGGGPAKEPGDWANKSGVGKFCAGKFCDGDVTGGLATGGEKSKPACGGGASGEIVGEFPGTLRIVLHFGHFAFLPAAVSGTRSCCWQVGHTNSIDMILRFRKCIFAAPLPAAATILFPIYALSAADANFHK